VWRVVVVTAIPGEEEGNREEGGRRGTLENEFLHKNRQRKGKKKEGTTTAGKNLS